MSVKRYRYGPLKVSVKDAGSGLQPWGRESRTAYKYEVTVVAPNGTTYVAPAWGSAVEFEQGERNRRVMARMTLDELKSAITDPDEWFEIVIGGACGRDAYEKGKTAERILKTAQDMGEQEVEEGAYAAWKEEEDGVSPKDWDPGAGDED